METNYPGYEYGIHIRHEPDWSGSARLSWTTQRHGGENRQQLVDAEALVIGDTSKLGEIPLEVVTRAVALAARGRADWDADRVLSQPPIYNDTKTEITAQTGFLFNTDFVDRLHGPRRQIPLGWINGVSMEIWHNQNHGIIIDIGTRAELPRIGGDKPNFDIGRIGRLYFTEPKTLEVIEAINTALIDRGGKKISP